VKGMNLIDDGAELVAEAVYRSARTLRGSVYLWVSGAGAVTMRSERAAIRKDLRDDWLVGRYSRGSQVLCIEDDLAIRRREIMGQPTRCAA